MTMASEISAFEQLPWLGPLLATLFGLIWGSFVNVLIYRLPLGRSVIFPVSACPTCKKPVAPFFARP